MRSQRARAEQLLKQSGYGGLWAWAMDERRQVRPPNWDQLSERLHVQTGGAVRVKGGMLRKWLLMAEAEHSRADSQNLGRE